MAARFGGEVRDSMSQELVCSTPITEALMKFIDQLPGDEWWSHSNRDKFVQAAKTMKFAGMPEPLIQTVLETLYVAVAAEYGA